MALSKTDIANNALTRVGANPITSIDDDTNNARVISRVYELSLRSILSECRWNFATKRLLLTISADTLVWYYTSEGENFVYVKPTDVIQIFGTNNLNATLREEGDYLISNRDELGIKYTQYHDVPSKYPAAFVDAFVDKLCSDIAYMIVNSATLGDKYKKIYETLSLDKAMTINSQTNGVEQIRDEEWVASKYNNTAGD